jgi:hypothetical protein
MRPADKDRLDLARQRFQHLKRQHIRAENGDRTSDAWELEALERRAHINLGFLQHALGLDG